MRLKIPQLSEERIREIGDANGVDQSKAWVLSVRGYYLDSMGKRGANDRRVYDDASFIVTPDGVSRFQFNTDPNGYRPGFGKGASKGMAMLRKGVHRMGEGYHKGYPAFVQCEKFTVIRDGTPPYADCGHHYIHLHSGGHYSTSSLGCQTVPRRTWKRYKMVLSNALRRFDNPLQVNSRGVTVPSFDYVLVEEVDLREEKLVVSKRYLTDQKDVIAE